jgi:hypothetical protein
MSVDPVRAAVAAEHGLDDRAASFLTGETVEAIDASAVALTKLLGERAEQGATASKAADPISTALGMKAQRQAALVQALHGQPTQERDQAGRFAGKTSTGFDGGARMPVAARRSPEAEHNEVVASLVGLRRTFGL